MDNVLILNSLISGSSLKEKKLKKIEAIFKEKFENVKVISTNLNIDIKELLEKEKENFNYLIIIGGDGFANKILNVLNDIQFFPILGFLPNGTLSGFRKKLKQSRNILNEAKKLVQKNISPLPLMSINNKLSLYFISFGCYSDVPYETKTKSKKIFKYFAYYFEALKRVFKKQRYILNIKTNNEEIEANLPFFMLLDGSHIAGFRVNKKYNPTNYSLNLFITPEGAFNGLLKYLFKKVKLKEISKMEIKNKNKEMVFCLDGEKYIFDEDIVISRENTKFKFLSN